MKRVPMTAALAVLLAAGATAQDGWKQKAKCCIKGVAQPWQGYTKGVKWTQPMDAALERAKKEKKPLLVFRLVGDLDKEGC